MKTSLILLIISSFINNVAFVQFYENTGSTFGTHLGIPIGIIKQNENQWSSVGISLAKSKKIFRGIYPNIGATFSQIKQENVDRSASVLSSQNIMLNTSILIQKRLFYSKGSNAFSCFFKSVGVIFAPEFNYKIPISISDKSNLAKGEFALLIGMDVYNGSKNPRRKHFIWDIYLRKGLTPFYSIEESGNKHAFYRTEVGLQLRILHHKMYRFTE
jgi:hypothetical protein